MQLLSISTNYTSKDKTKVSNTIIVISNFQHPTTQAITETVFVNLNYGVFPWIKLVRGKRGWGGGGGGGFNIEL